MRFSPNDIKAIIFDLGGTLLHLSYPFFRDTFQQQFKVALSEDDFFKAVSIATDALSRIVAENKATTDASRLPLFFEHLLAALPLPEEALPDRATYIHDFILREHARDNLWRYLLPNTIETLQALQSSYRLAMISNSDGRAEALTIQHGLRDYLEFVIDSHHVGVEKPDPRIFTLALERLELSPQECVYVGDVYSIDVIGATSAGLHAVLLDRTLTARENCRVVASLTHLSQIFLSFD